MSQERSDDCYMQQFTVQYEYPVHFARGILVADNDLLAGVIARHGEDRQHRAQVFVDSGVVEAFPSICDDVQHYFERRSETLKLECPPEIVQGGERAKNNRDAAERVMESIADRHLCRQSFVIAIGGGSVLDIVGLASSLVHRGVRLIRIPTTVLSQNDSGVGVKNGIDAYGVKNYAGTFVPPFAVLIDFEFLATLDDKYWLGGLSEAYKVAIIKDAEFFEYLVAHSEDLKNRDMMAMEYVVRRSAILHLEHIARSGDPFEFGASRPLDFGHWLAHRLEILSGYEVGHGQAVAIGIAVDSCYARRIGLISDAEQESILSAFLATGLPIWSGLLERMTPGGELEVLRGLEDFREHLGGELHVTLPRGIGDKVEVNEVDTDIVREVISYLHDTAQRR